MLFLLVMLFSAPIARPLSSHHVGFHATFVASSGDAVELDTRTGTLVTPRSHATSLKDCSDKVQVCLTDDQGFAFAYFRKCNDAVSEDHRILRFPPKIVFVLHNDLWMVFDAAPNYLFHYAYSRGIVGIYLGPTASFDFRSLLHERNFQWSSLDAMEYRITGSDTVAACRR